MKVQTILYATPIFYSAIKHGYSKLLFYFLSKSDDHSVKTNVSNCVSYKEDSGRQSKQLQLM